MHHTLPTTATSGTSAGANGGAGGEPVIVGSERQQLAAIQAAIDAFEQAPAPSLREVLGAYRLKGDGDREMLLAVLNAKAAEDQ
ncbi:hypothetical protein FRC17_007375, partial [Serendipita sp. 399]